MNIEAIKEFVVLAEELSFAATAERLFVSRSALSKHIQALEAELDAKLLLRTNQSVVLTEAGKNFFVQSQKLLEVYGRAVATTKAIADKGRNSLQVGYLYESAGDCLARACVNFAAQSGLRVELHALEVQAIKTGVAKGTLDLGFTSVIPLFIGADYTIEIMMDERLGILVPNKSTLTEKSRVALSDLKDMTIHGPNPAYLPDESKLLASYFAQEPSISLIDDISDIGSVPPALAMGAEAVCVVEHLGAMFKSGYVFLPFGDLSSHCALAFIWKTSNESAELLSFVEEAANIMRADGVGMRWR